MTSAAEPTAAFFANLQASGLLQPAQLQELASWMAASRTDVQGMAKELNRRGWLTQFQIREVFKGRARDLFLGPYIFLELLGEGGMGRVYKAHHTRLGKDVAVKVIRREKLKHPAAEGRFLQEVAALGKMRHPNVVDVFNADQVGDTHYYEMEYIDGVDLTRLVRERGPLPIPEACEYIRQAALGLHHAFEKGLVHRDIKPSNLLLSRNNRTVKLVDLGLARLLDAEERSEQEGRITQEGFVIGTPDFLAPEQARNPKAVDIRADIYSLGGTLFYLLTGKVPYEGSNPTEKLLKHCSDPPPSLLKYRADAPPQLDQIIQWSMAKAPEARPQTPLQFALALQPFCPAQAVYTGQGSGLHAVPGVPATAPQPVLPAPAYPAPMPGFPALEPEPNRSSQIFKLPSQAVADPIRRRGKPRFPWSTLLLGLGGLFILAVLAFAAYQGLLRPSDPPLESFTNSQGIKMVKLDGGAFRMGSPETEVGRRGDEGPVREVAIRGPLFVAATEVSHTQFLKVMGFSPSKSAEKANRAQNRPVENVTWDEANDFCKKLTETERDQKWMRRGWAYRLPTEAEWEFAARAGTETPFAFGDHIQFETQALFKPTEDDRYGVGDGRRPDFPQEVGKAEANRFGLHDMHGNVGEWCLDWYKYGYPGDGPRENPTGPSDGDKRVVRGGSFKEPSTGVRSASRQGVRPSERNDNVGFRVVYAPVGK
jgi:formylglycine-generating enzyme required for sulfatase activity/serine/threonine protein kinase